MTPCVASEGSGGPRPEGRGGTLRDGYCDRRKESSEHDPAGRDDASRKAVPREDGQAGPTFPRTRRPPGGRQLSTESLILAQDERWRRA